MPPEENIKQRWAGSGRAPSIRTMKPHRGIIPRKSAFRGRGRGRGRGRRGSSTSRAALSRSSGRGGPVAGPSTSAAASLYLPVLDYSTDYDSEVARLIPSKKTHVNSSDTEDASENGETRDGDGETVDDDDMAGTSEAARESDIKEQVYLNKLKRLKSELRKLEEGRHPQFLAEFEKVKRIHADRERAVEIDFVYSTQLIQNDFLREEKAAESEFEEKKSHLKVGLLMNLMKQKEIIESERYSLELSSDASDMNPVSTRKLRRRPNDPVSVPEKNRRIAPRSKIIFQLDDIDIQNDLNEIRTGGIGNFYPPNKSRQQPQRQRSHSGNSGYQSPSPSPMPNSDTRIEDGKLFYEKRWFHRGQPIYVEGKEMLRVTGVISSISQDTVWVRKVDDNTTKMGVPLMHLMMGKLTIKRRAY